MDKGDVYVCAGKGEYQGKPRAAVVLQSPVADQVVDSILVCPVTSVFLDASCRLAVSATEKNGLHKDSFLMVDKIGAMPQKRCRQKVGEMSPEDMRRLDHAICEALALPCLQPGTE